MRKLAIFEAYLDQFNEITVYLKNSYFEGKSNSFLLKNEQTVIPLTINQVKLEGDYQCYQLTAPFLAIGGEYTIVDERNLTTHLQFGYVVRCAKFDELFYYEHDDLGVTYSKEETTFKLWAPTANQIKIEILLRHLVTYELIRGDKGVWTLTLAGDLELATYSYLVKVNGQWNQATDPYAIASTPNHKRSIIIDTEKTKIALHKEQLPPLTSYTDAIIYEVHVRDFSTHPNSGIKQVGKFLGMCEQGTRTKQGTLTGLDYLADLGVTHLQFLPIADFGSVDEDNPFDYYNWGYDPVQFNVPEGSYASNISDPYARILELKQMIAKLHERGLRIIMDVVYNHMYDRLSSPFEKIVPNYYFKLGPDGEISNGSFCGNDLDSMRPMYRKFVIDSTKMWIQNYGVDGFRFDLMGILDIETMNLIATECQALDASVMIYGEGWNMPSLTPDSLKATIENHEKMPTVAHFNDQFRRSIKGSPFETELEDRGFGLGNTNKINQVMEALVGKPFNEPSMSINYIECHDNLTLFDRIQSSLQTESLSIRVKRQKLMNALILIAQGIPFLHAGQEFNRTKKGDPNSYRSPDIINRLDWDLKDDYQDCVNYVKDMIQLRKDIKAFRFNTRTEIDRHVRCTIHEHRIIEYHIIDCKAYSPYEEIKIYINSSLEPMMIEFEEKYQLLADGKGRYPIEKLDNQFTVEGVELIVLAKP